MHGFNLCNMYNEWIVLRAALCFKNTRNRLRIECIGGKAVYGFGGNTHHFPGAQQRASLFDCRRILRRTQQLGLHECTFFDNF